MKIRYSINLRANEYGCFYVTNLKKDGFIMKDFAYKKCYIEYFFQRLDVVLDRGVLIRVTGKVSRNDIESYINKCFINKSSKFENAFTMCKNVLKNVLVFPGENE